MFTVLVLYDQNNFIAKGIEAQECYVTCLGIVHPGSGCAETYTGIISLY